MPARDPVRPPELSELETFALAVELGSISRAGERLGISPPAAAKRIRQLESLAGEPLLVRGRRGVTVTEAGARLLPAVLDLLAGRETVMRILGRGSPADPLGFAGMQRLLGTTPGPAAAQRLRDTEWIFAAIFHATREGICIWDARTEEIREINAATGRILGYDQDDVRDLPIGALGVVEDPDALEECLRRAAQSRAPQTVEAVFRAPGGAGRRQLVSVRGEPIELRGDPFVLVMLQPLPQALTAVTATASGGEIVAESRHRFLAALRAGDLHAAEALADAALDAGADLATVHARLLAPAMHEIGELWARGIASVADEHAATEICHRVAARLFWRTVRVAPHSRPRVVIAAVTGELHILGSRLVADVLEGAGYDVLLLGADTPPAALLDACRRHDPAIVGLSVAVREHVPALRECLRALAARAPDVKVMLGGRVAAAAVAASEAEDGPVVVADAVEALAVADRFSAAMSPASAAPA